MRNLRKDVEERVERLAKDTGTDLKLRRMTPNAPHYYTIAQNEGEHLQYLLRPFGTLDEINIWLEGARWGGETCARNSRTNRTR